MIPASESRSITYTIRVTVEEKEEGGRLPLLGEMVDALADQIYDSTKHDAELPWRVVEIDEITASSSPLPFTGIQIGDHGHQVNTFHER